MCALNEWIIRKWCFFWFCFVFKKKERKLRRDLNYMTCLIELISNRWKASPFRKPFRGQAVKTWKDSLIPVLHPHIQHLKCLFLSISEFAGHLLSWPPAGEMCSIYRPQWVGWSLSIPHDHFPLACVTAVVDWTAEGTWPKGAPLTAYLIALTS